MFGAEQNILAHPERCVLDIIRIATVTLKSPPVLRCFNLIRQHFLKKSEKFHSFIRSFCPSDYKAPRTSLLGFITDGDLSPFLDFYSYVLKTKIRLYTAQIVTHIGIFLHSDTLLVYESFEMWSQYLNIVIPYSAVAPCHLHIQGAIQYSCLYI